MKVELHIKNVFDRIASVLIIGVLVPLFIVVALFIKFESNGGVFFRQKRCGLNGEAFYMYKFRTMVDNAEALKYHLTSEVEGSVFKVKYDPRITRIGRFLRKWSIDELPQLINVLKGEMSLVGPRPLEEKEMAGDLEWKKLRLTVKQGMTGLWQIKGRASCKFDDWIFYDTYYVNNWSLWLDFKILLMTIPAVLRKKGAY